MDNFPSDIQGEILYFYHGGFFQLNIARRRSTFRFLDNKEITERDYCKRARQSLQTLREFGLVCKAWQCILSEHWRSVAWQLMADIQTIHNATPSMRFARLHRGGILRSSLPRLNVNLLSQLAKKLPSSPALVHRACEIACLALVRFSIIFQATRAGVLVARRGDYDQPSFDSLEHSTLTGRGYAYIPVGVPKEQRQRVSIPNLGDAQGLYRASNGNIYIILGPCDILEKDEDPLIREFKHLLTLSLTLNS